MTVRAYVLIETAVGKTKQVLEALKALRLAGVKSVDAVTGPYNVIAVVEGEDLNAVGNLVTQRVHATGGIVRTTTCLAVELS